MKLKIFTLVTFIFFSLFSSIPHVQAEFLPTLSNHGVTNKGEKFVTNYASQIDNIHPNEGNFSLDSKVNKQYNQLSDDSFHAILSQIEDDNLSESKIIVGQDTRREVLDTISDHDYRTTVHLLQSFPDDTIGSCSGTLVSADKVLTSAHCVYNRRSGGFADEVYVSPAHTRDERPYGSVISDEFIVHNEYIRNENSDYDYAIIKLDQPIGLLTGWKGIATNIDRNILQQNTFSLSGYPNDKPYGSMWVDDGNLWFDNSLPKHIFHNIGTAPGSSGSGIYKKFSNMPSHLSYLVAVNWGNSGRENLAIDLTVNANSSAGSDVLNWIGGHNITNPVDANGFQYSLNHNTLEATITSYQGLDKDLSIPTHYTFNAKQYKITSINNRVFADKQINSVTLPDTLTHIGNSAFVNNNLTHIKLPASLVRIEASAFTNNNLKQVEFTRSIESMGSVVFSDNPLEFIDVPNGTIDKMASVLRQPLIGVRTNPILREAGTPKLQWDGSNWLNIGVIGENHDGTEGLQFSYNQQSLQATVTGYVGTSSGVNIPSSVIHNGRQYTITHIGNSAFQHKQLTSVKLPNTLINIGEYAFVNNLLTHLEIPDSVTQIQNYAFLGNSLQRVTIPKSITHLPNYAFGSLPVNCSFVVPVGSVEQMKWVLSPVAMHAGGSVTLIEGGTPRYVWAGIRGWEPVGLFPPMPGPMPGPIPDPF